MKPQASNITWHDGGVEKQHRESLLGQKGVILWFTGLSGSGKSTLAVAVEQKLHEQRKLVYRLDGDNIRHGLNSDLGFSPEDRVENIRRIGEVSKLFADAGVITMTSFISPYAKDREQVRALVDDGVFVEVYVKCSVEKCEERDPKGLYKKARSGEIPEFTGISAPYEEPEHPELVVETGSQELDQSVGVVIQYLEDNGIIAAD